MPFHWRKSNVTSNEGPDSKVRLMKKQWYPVSLAQLSAKTENPHKPIYLQGWKLEAGVRIGLFPPRLHSHNARFHWLIKLNRVYPTIPFLTRLVSVLVSTAHARGIAPATKGKQGQSA